jgi:transposase
MMTRRQKEPLRPLPDDERPLRERVSRAGSERADRVARAQAILAVADGASLKVAATRAGRRSGDGVAQLVARFNRSGLAALDAQPGGGATRQVGLTERARIVRDLQRPPAREQDGTATWSLTTLQRALRRAPDGRPGVSSWTILTALHEAGYTVQRDRTWCHTGTSTSKRTDVTRVAITDPDASPKRI